LSFEKLFNIFILLNFIFLTYSPNEPEELETNLYSYTGHSYSVLPLRRKMLAGRSQFRLKLQTFSSIGLILYASSSSLVRLTFVQFLKSS